MLLRGPTTVLIAASMVSGSLFFPQFSTVDDVPKEYFVNQKSVYGKVVRVIDGDTVRIRHCPTRFGCSELPNPKRVYDSTLSIRIYGVDTPEIQKRKSDPPSQPFGEDAKQLTEKMVFEKKVRVKLLRKDQYGRAVGKLETPRGKLPPFGRKDVSLELTKKGLATIYTGGGAEYDGNLELLKSTQEKAKKRRRGVWSLGDSFLSPAEFKKQQKQLKKEAAAKVT